MQRFTKPLESEDSKDFFIEYSILVLFQDLKYQ